MMIYDYLVKNFGRGEPIFIDELPCKSRNYLRQELKKLVDAGKLNRVFRGVYYLPYINIFGGAGIMYFDQFVKKKYLKRDGQIFGHITGLQLVNRYGFTTQNSAFYEVCSNKATTKQRLEVVEGMRILISKPKAVITNENVYALRFLDLLSLLDTFGDIKGKDLIFHIHQYIEWYKLDLSLVKKYLPLFPDKVYKYLYLGKVDLD